MKTYNWRVYSKTIKPNNIPSNPQHVYKNDGWISWGDFLGSGVISSQLIKYRDFNKARSFVRKLELSSRSKWNIYRISNKLPSDIPKAPAQVYKGKGWINWGDWLGSGSVQYNLINYQSFNKARSFVRQLNLNSQKEWYEYCHSGDKPIDIPTTPSNTYKNKGWKGISDWLGVDKKYYPRLDYVSYQEASEFAKTKNFKTVKEARAYFSSEDRPKTIPSNPTKSYKNQGWKGWGAFLGFEFVDAKINYQSFNKARSFVRQLNLNSQKEWYEYCHSGDKPIDIPKNPHLIYKNTGWNGLNDWLGKSSDLGYFTYSECVDAMIKLGIDKNLKFREYKKQNNSNKRIPRNPPHTYKTDWQGWSHFFGKKVKHYLSFEEQKRKVQSFNFQSSKEFKDYIKLNGDIEGVNNNPDNYSRKGLWNGWQDFLGYKEIPARPKNIILTYQEAKEYIGRLKFKSNTEFTEWSKSGKRPTFIPGAPRNAYLNDGWKGWSDFLGKDDEKN